MPPRSSKRAVKVNSHSIRVSAIQFDRVLNDKGLFDWNIRFLDGRQVVIRVESLTNEAAYRLVGHENFHTMLRYAPAGIDLATGLVDPFCYGEDRDMSRDCEASGVLEGKWLKPISPIEADA